MSRLSTLSGVLLVVLASLGLTQTGPCPGGQPEPPPPCTANADCDDEDGCTTDTCVIAEGETEGECDNTFACSDEDHCVTVTAGDEEVTACVECLGDDECDDSDACNGVETCDTGTCAGGTALECDNGDFCDGTETCDAATGCVAGTAPCDEATETCDEDNDECDAVCDDAADCDDGDPCTDDACVNNGCENTAVDCDNGNFCDGTESCDAATGDCVSSGDPCAAGETCNEDTDACDATPPCETDADCDDGVFCNGAETCDVDAGGCVAGERACPGDGGGTGACGDEGVTETCAEGDSAAVCTACPPETLDFTLSQDNLSGTTGNDVFSAALEFNAPSGGQIATLQTGDTANGLAGTDTLNATFNTAGSVVPALSGIEEMNLTFFGGDPTDGSVLTLNATSVSGVDEINSVGSVDDITIASLQETTNFGVSNVNNTSIDLALQFGLAATTSGTADTITGTISGSTVGTVTVQTAAGTTNGFETLALVSEGAAANTITTLTQTNGTSMLTANISGAQGLTLNTMPNTIRTYGASTMTGALQLGSGTSAGAYATFATANMTQITGGSGNDVIIFNNTLDTNDFTAQTCDLGTGTDVVQASFGTDLLTSSPFRNTEEFRINATGAATVNFNGMTGLTTISVEEDGTATALTLQNVGATASVFPSLVFRGDNSQAAQTYDTVTYTAVGNTGSSDSLTITVGNRGTALNASGTANAHIVGGGATTINAFETVSITCSDGPCTFSGIGDTTLVTLNVTGSSNVTLGQVDATAATILTVNAANVTGNFSATIDELGTGGNVSSGAGNDSVTIGANSTATSAFISLGAGNDTFVGDSNTDSGDTISAGDGSDTITGAGGNDTVTTGSGSDIVIYDQNTASDRSDVTDFTAGSGGDVARFDVSVLSLAGSDEYIGVIGSLAVNSSEEIAILTGAGYATDEAAEDAVAGRVTTDGQDMVVLYFNTTDSSTHVVYDPDAGVDGAGTVILLGRLTNITTQAAHDTLTGANVDTQP